MNWVIGFVIIALVVMFLRNAPVVGPLIFKPLFDVMWFVIAIGVLGGVAWFAYLVVPDDQIPDEIHDIADGIGEKMNEGFNNTDALPLEGDN